jgi:hypothetical protein
MIRLCENRPEGFGPSSRLHPDLPTTCFQDVVLVPGPTWLFLLSLVFLIPLYARSIRTDKLSVFNSNYTIEDYDRLSTTPIKRAGLVTRLFSAVYYILIVAMLAMVSLQIARLDIAQLGIGLLPFTLAGLLLAIVLHSSWEARVVRIVNLTYWIMLIAAMTVKLLTELNEQRGSEVRVKGQGTQGKYPTSDEVIDVAVMMGCVGVLAILEFNGWKQLPKY